ncbi:MAG: Uma2 family endonuclease [Micromonosporaceae bacterium]|nr:Uma2 family endonuclease [Micromonosporaceae bacterium]
MSAEAFEHAVPWTEEEFLALGETTDRVELFDGGLHVTPAPGLRHQDISAQLLIILRPAATAAGLAVYQTVNVRLKPDRIPIPDLVIGAPTDPNAIVVDAAAERLVCEIVSPHNAATDRVLKMHYYAEAGIPYYLLVEQEPLALHLYRLDGQHYVPQAKAEAGTVLNLEEPVRVEIDTVALG